MQKFKRNKKGFTLTELAVVIAVIAVLVAVLVPLFISLMDKAEQSADTQLVANLNNTLTIEETSDPIETPSDALALALSAGYSVENVQAGSDGNIVIYDQESCRFALVKSDLSGYVYKDSKTTKENLNTATTWLFITTSDSVVTATGTNTYTIKGNNSYILKGSDWTDAVITLESDSGLDTGDIVIASATTSSDSNSKASASTPVKKALTDEPLTSSTSYPLIYNIKDAHFTYNGGSKDVNIHGATYLSVKTKSNSNSITVANTVNYIDVTGSSDITIDIKSGGSTKLIAYAESVTVSSSSGTSLEVSVISSSYDENEGELNIDSLVTDEDSEVYECIDTVKTEPTCTKGGYTTYTYHNKYSGVDVTVVTNLVDAKGHTEEEAVTENEVEAACITEGSYDSVVYCSVCGEELSRETVTVEATGHTAGSAERESTVWATCTTDGHYDSVVYCSVCDEELSRETIAIPATGHTEGTTTKTLDKIAPAVVDNEIVAALTYTETTPCSVCSTEIETNTYTEYKKISALSTELKEKLYCDGDNYEMESSWEFYFNNVACTSITYDTYYGDETIVNIPTNVTTIANLAFANCTGLTSVTIPGSVTSISKEAFKGCTGLTSITIPSSVTIIGDNAFNGCTSLATITLSNGLSTIGASAFAGCSALTNIVIPDSVTTIGSSAFNGCSSLISMTIPFVGGSASATESDETTLFGYIFGTASYTGGEYSGQYTEYSSGITYYYVPKTLKTVVVTGSTVLYGAFSNCHYITSITLSKITTAADYVCFNCSALVSVTLANNITAIGERAFASCENLTSVTIPDTVTSIGFYAYSGCKTLTTITIPENVTSIANGAFNGCTGLETIKYNAINATVNKTTGSTVPYSNSIFEDAGDDYDKGITVTIGANVQSIPAHLFYSNETTSSWAPHISKVTFSSGSKLTSIGEKAFYGISTLTSISGTNYLSNVTTIGASVFSNTGITTFDTGKLTILGSYMLQNCTSLTSVTINSSLTSLTSTVFSGCTALSKITYNNSILTVARESSAPFSEKGSASGIELIIGEDVTTISANVFYKSYVSSITFSGNKVTTIGDLAFGSCSKLTSITLPASVTSVSGKAFSNCTSLTEILVAGGNTTYKSVDGNLYSYDGKTLVRYASGKTDTSLSISNSVTEIGFYALSWSNNLTEVIIGNNVTTIGSYAFAQCTGLKTLTIGDSVTSIKDNNFHTTTALTTVNVATETIWNGITFGTYNTYLTSPSDNGVTVNYTSLDTSTSSFTFTGTGTVTITFKVPTSYGYEIEMYGNGAFVKADAEVYGTTYEDAIYVGMSYYGSGSNYAYTLYIGNFDDPEYITADTSYTTITVTFKITAAGTYSFINDMDDRLISSTAYNLVTSIYMVDNG